MLGISANVLRSNWRATARPAELGVFASSSPESTRTGTSGIAAPGFSGDPAVRSAGQSMQASPPSKPAVVQAEADSGKNAPGSISARALS